MITKTYYMNKHDNLIYDVKEADAYIKKVLKKFSLEPTMFFCYMFFNAYFILMTAELEEEILSTKNDKNI